MSIGWIFLGILVVLVVCAVGAYNRLVALGQRVSQAFADIDVQLKQRHDLIPNLIETVKGDAAHERGTLDDVVEARNVAMIAQGSGQIAATESQLSGALGKLIALSEAYPDLKASAGFQQVAGELSDLENKIAASRRVFNDAVQAYNTGIQQMPAALFAAPLGFTRKDFFDLGPSRSEPEQVPAVKVLIARSSWQRMIVSEHGCRDDRSSLGSGWTTGPGNQTLKGGAGRWSSAAPSRACGDSLRTVARAAYELTNFPRICRYFREAIE